MSNTRKVKPGNMKGHRGFGPTAQLRSANAAISLQQQKIDRLEEMLLLVTDHIKFHHDGSDATCGWERDMVVRIKAAMRGETTGEDDE